MKKMTMIIAIALCTSMSAFAQRFAYVSTDYILSNIPEYQQAQDQLDKITSDWKAEVDKKQKEVDDLYRNFQNEQYLLTEDQKKSKIQEIQDKETAIKDYQKQKFGYDGELYQKRQELIKPIQDKVYEAIEKYAKDRGYDFIFDKSSGTTILFAKPENDKSADILKAMGYTATQKTTTTSGGSTGDN